MKKYNQEIIFAVIVIIIITFVVMNTPQQYR